MSTACELTITKATFSCVRTKEPTYQTTCWYLGLDGRINAHSFGEWELGYRPGIQIIAALIKHKRLYST